MNVKADSDHAGEPARAVIDRRFLARRMPLSWRDAMTLLQQLAATSSAHRKPFPMVHGGKFCGVVRF